MINDKEKELLESEQATELSDDEAGAVTGGALFGSPLMPIFGGLPRFPILMQTEYQGTEKFRF